MALQTHRPDYQAISSSSSQPYMKGRCGLTFILGPTDNPSAKSTGGSHGDHPTRLLVPISGRRSSRHSISNTIPSQATRRSSIMSAGSASGSSGNNDGDWKNISNPNERRKVQNRNAQRRHSMLFLSYPAWSHVAPSICNSRSLRFQVSTIYLHVYLSSPTHLRPLPYPPDSPLCAL